MKCYGHHVDLIDDCVYVLALSPIVRCPLACLCLPAVIEPHDQPLDGGFADRTVPSENNRWALGKLYFSPDIAALES